MMETTNPIRYQSIAPKLSSSRGSLSRPRTSAIPDIEKDYVAPKDIDDLRSSRSSYVKRYELPLRSSTISLREQPVIPSSNNNVNRDLNRPSRLVPGLETQKSSRISAVPKLEKGYVVPNINSLQSVKKQYERIVNADEDCPGMDSLPEVLESISRMRNQDVSKLRQSISWHRQELHNRDRKLQATEDKLEEAQKSKRVLVDKYEAKVAAMVDRERKCLAVHKRLQDMEVALHGMSNELSDKHREIQLLARSLDESRKAEADALEAIRKMEQGHDEMEGDKRRLETENQHLRNEFARGAQQFENENHQLRTKNENLQQQVLSLTDKMEVLTSECDELKHTVSDVDGKNEKLVAEWKRLNALAGKYRAGFVDAESEIERLTVHVQDQEQIVEDSKRELRVAQNEVANTVSKAQSDLRKCKEHCDQLERDMNANQARDKRHKENLFKDLNTIRSHLEAKKKTLEQKSAKLDRLKVEKVKLSAENASILKKDEMLEAQIRDLHQRLQQQEQEIADLKAWGPDGQPVIQRIVDGGTPSGSEDLTISEEIRRIQEAEVAFYRVSQEVTSPKV